MKDTNKFHENLVELLPEHILNFCIMNDINFEAIQIEGKVVKENNRYFFITNEQVEIKEKLEYNTEEQKFEYNQMIKNPQNLYAGLIKRKDTYDCYLLYHTGEEDTGEKELWKRFRIEYLRYKKVKTYKDFLKCLKKCVRNHNKTSSTNMTLSDVFPSFHDFDYIDLQKE